MKLIRSLVVVCSVMLGGGCKGPGTDVDTGLATRYQLNAIDDAPLPYTLSTGIDGSRFQVVGGEFVFLSRNMVLDVVRYQRTSGSGQQDPVIADTMPLPYTSTTSRVIVTRTRPDNTTFPDTMQVIEEHLFSVRSLRSVLGNYSGSYRAAYLAAP